jgi:LuxR family maltose regulon positive regulatory protein
MEIPRMAEKPRKDAEPGSTPRISSEKLKPMEHLIPLLSRPRLMEKLLRGHDRRLTFIQAPAGFGKSTLMSQWREHLVEKGLVCAWLVLDSDDRDPIRFLTLLANAFTAAGHELEQFSRVIPGATRGVRTEVAVATLMDEAEEVGGPIYLMLDDYHFVDGSEVDDVIGMIMSRPASGLRLVIATRKRAGLPISILKARGLVAEIGPEELRFSAEEATYLFGNAIQGEDVDALMKRTEGWAVALQLARLWIEDSQTPGEFIRSFSGSEGDVAEYLAEQVFSKLPLNLQEFLVETSHLERIHGDLADAVRGRSDSWDMLSKLEPLRALLVPIHGESGWCRHHQLFAEYLRQQLACGGGERVRELHLSASRWFAANGMWLPAVRHACQAGDVRHAAKLIEDAGGLRIGLRDGLAQLRLLLENLPAELIYEYPRLKLARSLLLSKEGRLAEARRHLNEVESELKEDDPALRSDILLMDVMLGIYEGAEFSEADVAAMEALAREIPEAENFVRGWLNNLLCIMQFHRGHLVNARSAAQTAMVHYTDLGAVYLQIFIHLHLGVIAMEEGELSEAHMEHQKASILAQSHFASDKGLIGLARVPLAEVYYEWNDLERARGLVFDALAEVEEYEGWLDIYLGGYVTASALALAEQGLEAALKILERADRTAAERRMPRLGRLVAARRIELFTLAGEIGPAAALARDIGLKLGDCTKASSAATPWRERWQQKIVLSRLALRQGKIGAARMALEAVCADAKASGNDRVRIKAQILLALVHDEDGDLDAAATALGQALILAVPGAYRRSFIDEGEPMMAFLHRFIRHTGIGALAPTAVEFIASVLVAGKQSPDGVPLERAAGIFSPREREILAQLNQGKSNKLIARALDMAEPTVKFHLRNVYVKLGVNNRALALAIAKQCDFVD